MKRPIHALLLFFAINIPHIASADIPEGYYKNADGKKKAALKAALHDIIRPEANYLLTYGSGAGHTWTGFYTTDRMPDGQVIDRYSYDKRYFPESASASAATFRSATSVANTPGMKPARSFASSMETPSTTFARMRSVVRVRESPFM